MWEILGIAPTPDIKAIKRAYAAKLKLTHPQDDPVAFQKLRQAYDWALHEAKLIAEEHLENGNGVADTALAQPVAITLNSGVISEQLIEIADTQTITADVLGAFYPPLEKKPVASDSFKIDILDPPASEQTKLEAPLTTANKSLAAPQQSTPDLFQEAKSHTRGLLKLLEETSETNLNSTLAAYFEQEWFIHIDARTMLEDRLIQELDARRVSPSYKVFAGLMEYFDWGNETLIRNHYDDKVMNSIRWLFKLAQEIYAVKTAKDKGWSKARFVALVKNPPKPMAFRFYAINPLIYEEAQRKLTLWDEEFPDIYAYLNPRSVAWWRDRLAGKIRPLFNFGSNSILYFFGASFIASYINIGISTVTGIFEPKSTAYQFSTWILTLALFLWFSRHRGKSPDNTPKEFALLKYLITYPRQFVKTRRGRLIGFGFVAINSLLLLVTFNDAVWFIALINLYLALLVWLEFQVFKWAFFSAMTMFMLSEFIPTDFNNKSSALQLLGMVVSGAGILKINRMSEYLQWGKAKHDFIFGLWLFLMLVLPIFLYSQMPWLIEILPRVSAYLTMVGNQL
jgi:hypothetical protein